MKQALKTKWVKALRSGKYKQGSGALGHGGPHPTYCCLGVLRHCVNPKDRRSDEGGLLSDTQLKQFGLTLDQQETLAGLNDGGKSFDYIANYIKEKVKVTK